ncbi:MAG: hypothetical protein HY075_01875 [Deltaproteobacteria bacterium]|nr:hypothetical protein [Deltaproteobacteria bacterium]
MTLISACAFALALTLSTSSVHAAGNFKVKPTVVPVPSEASFEAEAKAVGDWQAVSKRHPASGSKIVGSEDLMSKELKAFVDKLIHARHADALEALLKEGNEKYDTYPNDLKYVICRLGPLLPFRRTPSLRRQCLQPGVRRGRPLRVHH